MAMSMAGMAVVGGVMQAQQASKAGDAARSAASQNDAMAQAEYAREQGQIDQQAAQQKGDRANQADRDAATLQVMNGERGVSANGQMRSQQENSYFEGMDLSRIEQNRQNHIATTEAASQAATVQMQNAYTVADNQEESAMTSAFLGTVSSGLQIGANDYKQQQYMSIQQGQKSFTYVPPWNR